MWPMSSVSVEYRWHDAKLNFSHAYLLPPVIDALARFPWTGGPKRVFEVGAGNGAVAAHLTTLGYEVTGVEPSNDGVTQAHKAFPGLAIEQASTDEDLAARFGHFPVVLSLEVVEHVYAPRLFAQRVFELLAPGGVAIVSTPYHGYLKNVAVALSGKFDQHVNPLWDHGHIKFWSMKTLTALLREAGFRDVRYVRVGRVPALAKSMIAFATK